MPLVIISILPCFEEEQTGTDHVFVSRFSDSVATVFDNVPMVVMSLTVVIALVLIINLLVPMVDAFLPRTSAIWTTIAVT